jgi:hypothetical protein
MQDKEQIIIQATVSRTIEVNKQWYKFEYSEKRVVRKINAKEERKKLWQQCIDEVEEQIENLKKDLGL